MALEIRSIPVLTGETAERFVREAEVNERNPQRKALRDLNKVISDYFVQMADAELDRMWNEGTLNEERIESFRHLHERTPYNKPIL